MDKKELCDLSDASEGVTSYLKVCINSNRRATVEKKPVFSRFGEQKKKCLKKLNSCRRRFFLKNRQTMFFWVIRKNRLCEWPVFEWFQRDLAYYYRPSIIKKKQWVLVLDLEAPRGFSFGLIKPLVKQKEVQKEIKNKWLCKTETTYPTSCSSFFKIHLLSLLFLFFPRGYSDTEFKRTVRKAWAGWEPITISPTQIPDNIGFSLNTRIE